MDKKKSEWLLTDNISGKYYSYRKWIVEEIYDDGKKRYVVEVAFPYANYVAIDIFNDSSTNEERLAIFNTLEEARDHILNSKQLIKRHMVEGYARIKKKD